MMDTWRKKLFVVALATALVGVSSVAAAQEAETEAAAEAAQLAADEAAQAQDVGEEEEEEEPAEEEEDVGEEEEDVGEEEEPAEDPEEEQQDRSDDVEEEVGEPVDDEPEEEQQDPWEDVEEEVGEQVDEELEDPDASDEEEEEDEEPFSPTFGFGVETGFFFTDLANFNDFILAPNDLDTFEGAGVQSLDLVAESEVVENLRISILGGMTFSWQRNPSLFGWYVGIEPAYVVGDEDWEMALGAMAGVGGLRITAGDEQAAMSLPVARPFIEVRRHLSESAAAYVRAGGNWWWPGNPRSETMDLTLATPGGQDLGAQHLQTGGIFVATGFRYGALEGLVEAEELEATDDDDS